VSARPDSSFPQPEVAERLRGVRSSPIRDILALAARSPKGRPACAPLGIP